MQKTPIGPVVVSTRDFSKVVHGNAHLQAGLRKSREFVKSFVNGNLAINYQNKVLKSVPADVLRIFAQSKKLSQDSIFHNLLMNYVLMAEKRSPGASLPFVLSLLEESIDIQVGGLRTTEESIWNVLRTYVGIGQVSHTVKEIIQSTGYAQKIEFALRDCDKITVDVKNTEQIECNVDPIFGNTHTRLANVTVICIKGKIESIGEIDALLNWSHTENRSVILLAHEFSADVANTLRKNFDIGNVKVLPFVFHGYASNNDIEDLSTNLNVPLLSTETGLRFSNIDYDDITPINNCLVDGCHLHVETKIGKNRSVQVMIPYRLKPVAGVIEDRIKCGLLLVKSAARFGVTKLTFGSNEYFIPNNTSDYFRNIKASWDKNFESIACSIFVELE